MYYFFKIQGKFDPELAQQVIDWVNAVTGESVGSSRQAIQDDLKNGVIVCNLINTLQPGSVKKINESKMAFKMVKLESREREYLVIILM